MRAGSGAFASSENVGLNRGTEAVETSVTVPDIGVGFHSVGIDGGCDAVRIYQHIISDPVEVEFDGLSRHSRISAAPCGRIAPLQSASSEFC